MWESILVIKVDLTHSPAGLGQAHGAAQRAPPLVPRDVPLTLTRLIPVC